MPAKKITPNSAVEKNSIAQPMDFSVTASATATADVTPNLPLPTFEFTQDALRRLFQRPGEAQSSWFDAKVKGLRIVVGAKGKTFYFEHRVAGIGRRKPKIGRFAPEPGSPGWTVEKARKRSRELEVMMDRGDDPTLIVEPETMPESSGDGDGTFDRDKFSVKNALDFLAQWFETNDKSDKTIKKLQSDTNTVKPIWKRPLLSLTKLECHKLHKHIRDKVRGKANADALAGEYGHFIGNYAANSALTHLQLAFNKCQYWLEEKGFPQDALNPIRKGFPWYPERSNRDRIKMGGKPHEKNQLPEWWDETERTLNAVEKMIWRLSLFTGFRNRDCCKIRWDEIKNIDDDTTATMFRPEPKGGKHRAFHVPLSTAALAILRERREAQDKAAEKNPTMRKCPWVFPTYSKAGMLTRVEVVDNQETVNGKKTPNKILGKHHNLRRTFETALKHSGVEKQDRQALMNHKYAVKSSDVHDGYDEPDTEFVRSKTQAAADFIMQRGGLSIDEHGKLVRKVDTQPPQPLRIAS